MTWTADQVATELLACESQRRHRTAFSDDWPELDLTTAYRIQDETLRRRLARGECLTGIKLGLTSKVKQERMGVNTPLVAWLTDAMALSPHDAVPSDRLIHPRIEPEIALVLRDRLEGPGVTRDEALAAVAEVRGGAEIIDSRYTDFRFTVGDVVADNASSGAYLVGDGSLSPADLDMSAESVELVVDGQIVDQATGAAVLGHPAEALALAANVLAARGCAIEPGWAVFTGGLTDAVAAAPGSTVTCRFDHLGEVTLTTPQGR